LLTTLGAYGLLIPLGLAGIWWVEWTLRKNLRATLTKKEAVDNEDYLTASKYQKQILELENTKG